MVDIMMEEDGYMERKNLLLASIFFSFTLCFFAPIELYLTNRQEFWFGIKEFIVIPIIMTITIFLVLIAIGRMCSERAKCIWTGLIFGVACMVYLQGNFMNYSVGTMNGMLIKWEDYRKHFALNWGIWVLFITFVLIWYTKNGKNTKRIVGYISLFVTMIQVITISTLLIAVSLDESNNSDRYLSMKNVYDISSEENVIVLILDMFDDRYFDEMIVENAQIADVFDGFTQYTNFTGTYGTTVYSIGHLLTGEYLLNQKGNLERDINYLYENTDVFDEFIKQGYNIDIYTYDYLIPYDLKDKLSNYCDGQSEITNYVGFTKNLYSLVACKYLPDFAKQHCWLSGTEFDELRMVRGEYPRQSFSNSEFYRLMVEQGLTITQEKEFKFIHLDGTHYPYTIDENAIERGEGNVTFEQTRMGIIKIIQEYLDGLKKAGVYDNSSIIIMADHGYYRKGLITNPLLLIKPKNSHGELKFSEACISQKDFQPTLLSLAGLNDDLKYGCGFTDVEEGVVRDRYYYQYVDVKNKDNSQNRRLIEYKIDADSNERENYHITGYEYNLSGDRINHYNSCAVCQNGDAETDSFDAVIIHE